ncbi:tRNA (guanine-N(1)-)-methyltransferase [Geodia barretti]|uniref:tRNA (guanine-N(1)-)-methyltransferase n=2 Tax=Geodia barretti TaxID=519541 RepID=A0AA35W520_GEOBA|nr:tRNA (guanine-N(1)-)-methyltransferase [Geodia barretti]
MRFHVLTLFPEAFAQPLQFSIVARAVQRGQINIDVADIRDYTHDAHGTADDYQFGGGHGMVMKPEPVFEAAEATLSGYDAAERAQIPVILTTPQGELLTQKLVEELASSPAIAIICGHYAGVDERIAEGLATRPVSIGDYVLTGGELPAMIIIDAVTRLLPGVVGSPESVAGDSITTGLLQHPLYTRPAEFRGMTVPEVLLSGHHAEIDRWRRRKSLERTLEHRPDLLSTASLTNDDRRYLAGLGYAPPDAGQVEGRGADHAQD